MDGSFWRFEARMVTVIVSLMCPRPLPCKPLPERRVLCLRLNSCQTRIHFRGCSKVAPTVSIQFAESLAVLIRGYPHLLEKGPAQRLFVTKAGEFCYSFYGQFFCHEVTTSCLDSERLHPTRGCHPKP